MAVCERQVLPLDMAICCSIGCLHLMEDSLFSHCQCSASSKAFKGSRSNDIVQVIRIVCSIFLSYELHVIFQILKVSASIWNEGSFLLEVMPRKVIMKENKKLELVIMN
ncbi:hypothetical protein MKW98_012775 [Papaver atlanticum]|uniref:Glycerophosphocholine acyltransferase 1 n=1 Tax=Papaver atlanticum TaxID=357466 RepID=A0AAD4SMV2_9MAGN|nr:hypothetical protein MKW98_012775 [Papaver atlanticum]